MAIFKNNPPIVTDGLVLYLDAANRQSYISGSTTWNDISGRRNNGTLVNGPIFSRGNGGNIVFDGINDAGQLQFQYTNTYTINIIIRFTGNISEVRAIIDVGNIEPNSVRLYLNNSRLKIQHTSTFDNIGVSTTQIVPTNIWKNYTVTGNGSLCQIFEEGILNNSGSTASSPNIQLNQVGIANKPTGSTSNILPLSCNIALIQIYNRVLTPQEVLQNYNATKSRFNLL